MSRILNLGWFSAIFWCPINCLLSILPRNVVHKLEESFPYAKPYTNVYWKYFENLNICNFPESKNHQEMILKCTDLKNIQISGVVDDSKLYQLFINNNKLQELVIINNNKLTGECLEKLPLKIKRLEFINTDNLDTNLLLKSMTKWDLESFKIYVEYLDENFLKNMSTLTPNLKELSLTECLGVKLEDVKLFPKLTSLNLVCVENLSDGLIELITNNCVNLEKLEFSDYKKTKNHSVTTNGFLYLTKLKNLKYLILKWTDLADSNYICNFVKKVKLERLDVEFCEGFTDDVVENVLANGPCLNYLKINDCPVTNNFLECAVTALEKQNERVDVLEIFLSSETFDENIIAQHFHRNLKVVIKHFNEEND